MTILVCTTTTAAYMDTRARWGSWMLNAESLKASAPDVHYFAALQLDNRGLEPLLPFVEELQAIGGEYWTFSLDDGRTEITTNNRLRHITMGQNVCMDRCAGDGSVTHQLFLAADLMPPADALTKLLEVDWPFVGGHVPTYCLDGPQELDARYPGDCRWHMPTAAFVLLTREMFQIRWRYDLDQGWSDDPALYNDARNYLGIEAIVRHDCVGQHYPQSISAIENRLWDKAVVR